MSPEYFLIFLAMLTGAAATAQIAATKKRRRSLRGLATQWQMHFVPWDRLRLGERISGKIPVLGAADVRVMDLLFRTEGHRHRYVFTVEYGVGIIRGKRRRKRVAGFDEPVRRGSGSPVPYELELMIAPESMPMLDAYRHVWQRLSPSQIGPGAV